MASLALYGNGNALTKLGKYDEAIEAYDNAIEVNPPDSVASLFLNCKGLALTKEDFDKPLISTNCLYTFYKLSTKKWGLSKSSKLNKSDEALKAYDKANEINHRIHWLWPRKELYLNRLNKADL